ncbi:hypothetical protein [Natrinema versiforme]|uniref:Uncharacterized protein n=1 Tax=Natrinema versiforme TaxID=88724 RepID=A0A4P8WR12_9EURY|nr:hypothetical protein [Natrinema versiforme]QCS44963.1 hypothetical protein FEJ81_22070 [Natrinema versiforme]
MVESDPTHDDECFDCPHIYPDRNTCTYREHEILISVFMRQFSDVCPVYETYPIDNCPWHE